MLSRIILDDTVFECFVVVAFISLLKRHCRLSSAWGII
uniref:Uncharacterized protein n=1 Tax=Anguilla anguilla TaxID=7936 RepID=A0A0E9PBA4_ANGAN